VTTGTETSKMYYSMYMHHHEYLMVLLAIISTTNGYETIIIQNLYTQYLYAISKVKLCNAKERLILNDTCFLI